jgi:Chalcone isomerase-like
MQSRRRLLLASALLPLLAHATTQPVPAELAAELPDAKLQGSGILRFLGLKIYAARLWVPPAFAADDWATRPLALELEYARNLPGAQIAERSLKEMRRHAEIAQDTADRWLAAMKQLFPDVKAGDRITGLHLPAQGARFFLNGRLLGDVREGEFARLFMSVWLSDKTSEPSLRQALLGKAP